MPLLLFAFKPPSSVLILISDVHSQMGLFSYLLSLKVSQLTVACDFLGEVRLHCLHHISAASASNHLVVLQENQKGHVQTCPQGTYFPLFSGND